MPSRRRLLAALPIVGIAGCLQDPNGRSTENKTAANNQSTSSNADEPSAQNESEDEPREDDSPNDVEEPTEEIIRSSRADGQADPISVEREEWDEHVEYIAEDDEVTYVKAWTRPDDSDLDELDDDEEPPDRVPELGRRPWDRWKHYRAHLVASRKAVEAATDELDWDQFGYSISPSVHPESRATAVVTCRVLVDDANEDLPEDAPSDAAAVAEVLPAEITATYVLDDKQFEETYKTRVEYEVFQMA